MVQFTDDKHLRCRFNISMGLCFLIARRKIRETILILHLKAFTHCTQNCKDFCWETWWENRGLYRKLLKLLQLWKKVVVWKITAFCSLVCSKWRPLFDTCKSYLSSPFSLNHTFSLFSLSSGYKVLSSNASSIWDFSLRAKLERNSSSGVCQNMRSGNSLLH